MRARERRAFIDVTGREEVGWLVGRADCTIVGKFDGIENCMKNRLERVRGERERE